MRIMAGERDELIEAVWSMHVILCDPVLPRDFR